MKRILATTAMALMLSTSAFADAHIKPLTSYQMEQSKDIYASEFIGMRIYATESPDYSTWNTDTVVNAGAEKEWDDIGEVNDVILGRDGSVKAVILGIGGFIGIGERDVAVSMDDIKMVNEQGEANDFFLVIQSNKAMLEQAPAFERTVAMQASETAEGAEERLNATAETAERKMDEAGRTMLRTPAMTPRDGYADVKMEELTAEMLTGTNVYGSKDEDIGEVGELVLDDGGKIKQVVLDVGGFLGLGEHHVAVTLEELRIVRNDNGDDVRVYIDATQEELEQQPEYNNS